MDHRREIDGLRAVAVLPVIFFHAGFEAFRGGFVGVDVFFVISGYLITTIILGELEEDKFSIVSFYERRARRILPALFLVMLVCLPFAWFWLLPSEMEDFAESLVAVSAFVSNILFWRESGYFETTTELKPLLHTWSLAVEEQYYVLFPVFLILLRNLRKRWTLAFLGLAFLLSLALAQWAVHTRPAAAFYLLPTRGWELLVGAFAAFYLSKTGSHEFSKGLSEIGGWLGVILIVYAVFSFNSTTPFPGLHALVPTLGAMLVIVFATRQTAVGRFVGNRAFSGIGLISYSAYLWHQPLFAFARLKKSDDLDLLWCASLSMAALVLAYFSWRYVEAPFRKRTLFGRRKLFLFALVGSLFFTVIGLLGTLTKGFDSRLDENQRYLLSFESYDFREIYRQGDCFLNPEQSHEEFKENCYSEIEGGSQLIWGDSHAAALSYGLRKELPYLGQFTASGCPPLLGVSISKRPTCKDINGYVADKIENYRPAKIILHANWLNYDESIPLVRTGLKIAEIE